MVANGLTKPLPIHGFKDFVGMLGLATDLTGDAYKA